MNDPDIEPPAAVQTGLEMRFGEVGVAEIRQGPVSPAAKFEPVTSTTVPGCPNVGINMTVALTVKVAVAKS